MRRVKIEDRRSPEEWARWQAEIVGPSYLLQPGDEAIVDPDEYDALYLLRVEDRLADLLAELKQAAEDDEGPLQGLNLADDKGPTYDVGAELIKEADLSMRGAGLHFKEDAGTEALGKAGSDWLRGNDPQLVLQGVADEIAAALEAEGMSLEAVRRSAFPNGRPRAAARALRSKVRAALQAMYEDGRRRVLMAEALGCSTTALHGLMASGQKP